jgi:arsenical pump membrane protein
VAEALASALLAVILAVAIARPAWLPESLVAAVAAAIVIGTGALPPGQARSTAARLWPVLAFLAAVLVLGRLCEEGGLFAAAGARLARYSRADPRRLLAGVFALAAATTAVLSLDTTVVLVTPVVHETVSRLGMRQKPFVYACTHLANSASLLLPVSNLTNLLAFAVSGLTLVRFTELMALPWAAAIAVEYAAFRLFFAADLAARPAAVPASGAGGPFPASGAGGPVPAGTPVFSLAVIVATLAGFVVTSFAGLSPAWAALAGACVLGARELAARRVAPRELVRAASIPFLLFVLGLGLVVRAVVDHGLGGAIAHLLPHGSSLPSLLAIAGIAAVLANVVNNLPAVLVLVSVLASRGIPVAAGPLLAVLIGVNIGPNLSYAGSLATLLWRRLLAERGHELDLGEFTRLGLLTVPAGLLLATIALWAALSA